MPVARYALALLVTVGMADLQAPVKREHFQNADVLYDWVTNSKGEKLRSIRLCHGANGQTRRW